MSGQFMKHPSNRLIRNLYKQHFMFRSFITAARDIKKILLIGILYCNEVSGI